MSEDLTCSTEECVAPAVEALRLRGQLGHIHDCSEHAALVREWCDVIDSRPLVDGACPYGVCTVEAIHTSQPRPL